MEVHAKDAAIQTIDIQLHSEKAHNWLRNNAPYQKAFDITSVLSDIIATTCSIEDLCKCAPALIGKGLNAFNGGKKLTGEGEKLFLLLMIL